MKTTGLNRWLKQLSPSIRGSRHGRRARHAVRPGGEALERRMVLSTLHWTGDGGNANWSNKSNWEEGKAPVADDDLVFQGSVHQLTNTNDLAANTAFKSITFEGAPYVISGNAIKFEANGTINVTATGATKFNLPIVMGAGLTITTVDRANLNLGGAISGAGGLNKSGKGALALSGSSPNTFTGGLLVTQGMVQLSKTAGVVAVPGSVDIRTQSGSTPIVRLVNSEQIDKNAIVFVHEGCTLDLSDETQTLDVLNVVGGKVEGDDEGKLILLGFSNSGEGTINVALSLGAGEHNFSITSGTLTINGPISGEASTQLIKSGQGTLKFAGSTSNTYAGTTLVNQGTLLLSKSAVKPEDAIAVPGPLVIGNASRQPATVRIEGNSGFKEAVTPVTVNYAGVLDLNKHTVQVASLTMTGGTVTNGSMFLGGNLKATSVAGPKADSPSQSALISAHISLGGAMRTFTVQDGPAAVDLNMTGQIDAASGIGLTKDGAGTLQFSGSAPNTYTGATTVKAGRLELNKKGDKVQSISGPLTIGDDAQGAPQANVKLLDSNEIKDNSAVTVKRTGHFDLNNKSDYIGALTLSSGDVKTGTGVLSLNHDLTATSVTTADPSRITGKLNLAPDGATYTRKFTINRGLASQDLIVDGVISGPKGLPLTKAGAGTLRFTGSSSNTYQGMTTVDSGLLELFKSNAQAVIGPLTILGAKGAQNPGEVRLLNSQQIAANSSVVIRDLGLLDLNQKTQDLSSLTMSGGLLTTGNQGVLTLLGGVSAQASLNGTGTAKITGRLNLNHNATVFDVSRGSPATAIDLIIDASLINAPGINKHGNGVMEALVPQTDHVPFGVAGGVLRVSGQRDQTLVFLSGGTYEGSGTVKLITSSGDAAKHLRAGTSTTVGALKVIERLELSASTTLDVKLKSGTNPVPGTNYDQFTSGRFQLNGATLQLNGLDFTAPAKGTRYRIINNLGPAPLTTRFGNVPTTGSLLTVQMADGKEGLFRIEYGVGTHGNDVDLVFKGVIH